MKNILKKNGIMSNGIGYNGIPTLKEKVCLWLNVPEYWNRLNGIAENIPYELPGRKAYPHEMFPWARLDQEEQILGIQNLRTFRNKWRIPSQFIQPFFFGIMANLGWFILTKIYILAHSMI